MIAIKGMEEMPENCFECCLTASECHVSMFREDRRADGCPLVEIVTCKNCKYWHDNGIMTTCDKTIGNGFPKDYYCADGKR